MRVFAEEEYVLAPVSSVNSPASVFMRSNELTVPEAGARVKGEVGTVIVVPEYSAAPLTSLKFEM